MTEKGGHLGIGAQLGEGGGGAQTHPEAGVHLLQVAALVLQHALEQLPIEIWELRTQRIQVHCRYDNQQSTSEAVSCELRLQPSVTGRWAASFPRRRPVTSATDVQTIPCRRFCGKPAKAMYHLWQQLPLWRSSAGLLWVRKAGALRHKPQQLQVPQQQERQEAGALRRRTSPHLRRKRLLGRDMYTP